jgi:hypothetical protein
VYGILIRLTTRPGKWDEVLDFLRWDADVARHSEPDTLRFDVWGVPGEADTLYPIGGIPRYWSVRPAPRPRALPTVHQRH